jgi:hypothetical protein
VTAAVACFFASFAGPAAAGIPKFQVRCAGITVAGRIRKFFMLLAAGAGMQGGGFLSGSGFSGIFGLCIFWHVFTIRTGIVR